MLEFILGFLAGKIIGFDLPQKTPVEKWAVVLNYCSDRLPPVPKEDQKRVATLLDEGEKIVLRYNLQRDWPNMMVYIRKNYKMIDINQLKKAKNFLTYSQTYVTMLA